jgi:hypothetical protein
VYQALAMDTGVWNFRVLRGATTRMRSSIPSAAGVWSSIANE